MGIQVHISYISVLERTLKTVGFGSPGILYIFRVVLGMEPGDTYDRRDDFGLTLMAELGRILMGLRDWMV